MMIPYDFKGVDPPTSGIGSDLDSFDAADDALFYRSDLRALMAQAFDTPASPEWTILAVRVRLRRDGTVGGSWRVAIFGHTGTFGTNGTPDSTFSGDALAYSGYYAADGVSTSVTEYIIPIPNFIPDPSTEYTAVLDLQLVDRRGDTSNRIIWVADSGAEATHDGSLSFRSNAATGFTAAAADFDFGIFGTVPAAGGPAAPARITRLHYGMR